MGGGELKEWESRLVHLGYMAQNWRGSIARPSRSRPPFKAPSPYS